MAFKKLDPTVYPRRLWSLVGFPGSGKSTFAMRLRGPLLVIDADHRVDEVARLAPGGVYQLSARPADNVDAERIAACLRQNMPDADIGTVVVDSLTAILAPLVTEAILANDAGRNKNRMAAFKTKALALRLLQDMVGAWGTDVLYIYHWQQGRDASANEVVTATISRTELARLQRSINVQLSIVEDGARRGIHVDWARQGRSELTLWDASGTWAGLPEQLEAAIYGGLSADEQARLAQATPKGFTSAAAAIAWGEAQQGVFEALAHARNAYDMVKEREQPPNAPAMWEAWIAEVLARKAAQAAAAAQASAAVPPPAADGQF